MERRSWKIINKMLAEYKSAKKIRKQKGTERQIMIMANDKARRPKVDQGS